MKSIIISYFIDRELNRDFQDSDSDWRSDGPALPWLGVKDELEECLERQKTQKQMKADLKKILHVLTNLAHHINQFKIKRCLHKIENMLKTITTYHQ